MTTIAIIPARGGSKGIPRKNIRPLAGKPMIYYSIKACIAAEQVDRVVVSTDDEEISLLAGRFGADVLIRPSGLSEDSTTLDPVIEFVVAQSEDIWGDCYRYIITVQPTAPLITKEEVNEALLMLKQSKTDTVLSVVEDRHLAWTIVDGVVMPLYAKRVNRQQLPANFRETGAIIACTKRQLELGSRIGKSIQLLEISQERSFDIDTYSDLALCESMLKRKRIIFTVIGYDSVGLGHVNRALLLANELTHYDIQFLCARCNHLAIEYVREHNYPLTVCAEGELLDACIAMKPDMVVNDILDTEKSYISALKQAAIKVVNFEDLGSGTLFADAVINALYPSQYKYGNVLHGHQYFCLRDEFLYLPERDRPARVERVLITCGGIDENNVTARCLRLICGYCIANNIYIDIVTGLGYKNHMALREYIDLMNANNLIVIVNKTRRISDYMARADLAITSGGRTVFELCAMHVPAIVICQNQRETTHSFASSGNGALNLGFHGNLTDDEIQQTIVGVMKNPDELARMRDDTGRIDLSNGKRLVIKKIIGLLEA